MKKLQTLTPVTEVTLQHDEEYFPLLKLEASTVKQHAGSTSTAVVVK